MRKKRLCSIVLALIIVLRSVKLKVGVGIVTAGTTHPYVTKSQVIIRPVSQVR